MPEMTQRLLHAMSRQRKYQLRHQRAGLCCECSRPAASGTLFCELHRRKRNLENREKQRKSFKRKIRYLKAESYKFPRIRSNLVVNRIYTRAALSRREAQVLRLLGDGKTTQEIAAKLKVSLKTVQRYCARLKQKLDAANFSRLIRIGVLWRAGVAKIVVRGVGRE
jgi:DNA-binding CsgD family transcriptional regulator